MFQNNGVPYRSTVSKNMRKHYVQHMVRKFIGYQLINTKVKSQNYFFRKFKLWFITPFYLISYTNKEVSKIYDPITGGLNYTLFKYKSPTSSYSFVSMLVVLYNFVKS